MTLTRRTLSILFSALGLFIAPNLPLQAETPASPRDSWQPVPATVDARQRTIHSTATNRDYRIIISIPRTSPPVSGYPVLYLLDGQQTFPLAAFISQGLSTQGPAGGNPAGIIVGIVHIPTDTDKNPRAEDFTPPAPDLSDTGEPSNARQGGADRFVDFLEKELKPLLAAEFPIDSNRQTIFGHSYGALCVLHTLFTRPATFQHYFAASPSIWWNKRFILTECDSFIKTQLSDLQKSNTLPTLALSVGDAEQTPQAHHAKGGRRDTVLARRMIDNARDLAASLESSGLKPRFYIFENENHGTTRVPALNQAIRVAFEK